MKNKVLYSSVSQEQHCFVCAGTGKGKTSSLLIPTLRSWTGSSLTIDISGDISNDFVQKLNFLIYIYRLEKSPCGLQTTRGMRSFYRISSICTIVLFN